MPGTETCDKQYMKLDHVIPIRCIWTHPHLFYNNPLAVNIIAGWYNILPIAYGMNRHKSDFVPALEDIQQNMRNKRLYFEDLAKNNNNQSLLVDMWLEGVEEEYERIYTKYIELIGHK